MKYVTLLSLLILAACGGNSTSPQLYTLKPNAVQTHACKAGSTIRIYEAQAAPGLDTPRIVVVDSPQHQTFYNGVRWTAPAGRLIQNYLIDSFEQSGMFATVTSDDSTTRSQWLLETQLRAFHVDQSSGSPRTVVRMTLSFADASTKRVVMTLPLTSHEEVAGKPIEAIIASFERQMAQLSAQALERFRKRVGCR